MPRMQPLTDEEILDVASRHCVFTGEGNYRLNKYTGFAIVQVVRDCFELAELCRQAEAATPKEYRPDFSGLPGCPGSTAPGVMVDSPADIEALARATGCTHIDLNGDRAKALERLRAFAAAVRADGVMAAPAPKEHYPDFSGLPSCPGSVPPGVKEVPRG